MMDWYVIEIPVAVGNGQLGLGDLGKVTELIWLWRITAQQRNIHASLFQVVHFRSQIKLCNGNGSANAETL